MSTPSVPAPQAPEAAAHSPRSVRETLGGFSRSARKTLPALGRANVAPGERLGSLVTGAALLAAGLRRGGAPGLLSAAAGGALLLRGATGHCALYQALGINTAGPRTEGASLVGNDGICVEKTLIINRSPEDLYRFWRDFENLPRVMRHLESVTVQDGRRSRWVVRGPAGRTVEWDAEIINERENELIAWRSLEGADVRNAGSVRFTPDELGRGTWVKISLMYQPPAGRLGAAVARLFGEEPHQQIEEDLRRLKQFLETGEIATVEGQPSCRAGI